MPFIHSQTQTVKIDGVPTEIKAEWDEERDSYVITVQGLEVGTVRKQMEMTQTRRWVCYDRQGRRTGFCSNLGFAAYSVARGTGSPRVDLVTQGS